MCDSKRQPIVVRLLLLLRRLLLTILAYCLYELEEEAEVPLLASATHRHGVNPSYVPSLMSEAWTGVDGWVRGR